MSQPLSEVQVDETTAALGTTNDVNALVQNLVKLITTTEERLSRIEKKLDDLSRHVSNQTRMIQMAEDEREDEEIALDHIEDGSAEGISW